MAETTTYEALELFQMADEATRNEVLTYLRRSAGSSEPPLVYPPAQTDTDS